MSEDQPVKVKEKPALPTRLRVDELALAGGYLPEFLPGSSRFQPVIVNPKHGFMRAACLRAGWNEHSLVTRAEFDNMIATVSDYLVR